MRGFACIAFASFCGVAYTQNLLDVEAALSIALEGGRPFCTNHYC